MKKNTLKLASFAMGLLFLCNSPKVNAQSYVITDFAGDGTNGFSGDGSSANLAQFAFPNSVAIDDSGNIYISDDGNHRIRKVNTSGVISTIAGSVLGYSGDGGSAFAAGLKYPQGIAVSSSGDIYIADMGNHVVRKITNGIISTIAGDGTSGYAGDGGQAISAQLADPCAIALDGNGNIFISDKNKNVVRKVDASGVITTYAGNGTSGFSGDGGIATSAELNQPQGIFANKMGELFIADAGNNVIRKVHVNGNISTISGSLVAGYTGDGGQADTARLNQPVAIILDEYNNIFFSEMGNHVIRKIDANGIISTIAGTGTSGYNGDGIPALTAELNNPYGISLDAIGNLYFVDQLNQRVRILETSTPAGLNEFSEDELSLSVYPNPSTGQINIKIQENESVFVQITDISGHVKLSPKKLENGMLKLDVNDYLSGIYFVKITTRETSQVVRFVKE